MLIKHLVILAIFTLSVSIRKNLSQTIVIKILATAVGIAF